MLRGTKETVSRPRAPVKVTREDAAGHTCKSWSRLEQNAIMEDVEDTKI